MMKVQREVLCLLHCFVILIGFVASVFAHIPCEDEAEIHRSQFPNTFFFGSSTSAYQIEGAYIEDGKSLTNWDVFSHIPGNINNDENGDVADDHYHRYLEDIELMHSLGVNAYRFSISWARILPGGRFGNVNPKGVLFYNKIIDNLLLRGIEPFVTIFHHDLPQILEDSYGGWLNHSIQEDFAHYAKICFKKFGDRVKYWISLNEPNHLAEFAYMKGVYPPARCSPPFGNCSTGNSDTEPLIAMHNMLMAHALAAQLYRNHFKWKQNGFIGISGHVLMYEPLRDEEADGLAVSRALAFNTAWMFDPLVLGDYPPEMRNFPGLDMPSFSSREKQLLKGSIDFIGINHYSTLYAKDCIHSACSPDFNRPIRGFVYTVGERDGVPIGQRTGMPRFYVVPKGFEESIHYLKQRYNNMPIIVVENGVASVQHQNEQIEDLLQDVNRVEFHKAYLAALVSSLRNGADVRGYFIWSLMDNLEWTSGYSMRFGLYHVDRKTLKRTPKHSAKWFANFLDNTTSIHIHTRNFINGKKDVINSLLMSDVYQ